MNELASTEVHVHIPSPECRTKQ